MNRQLIAALKKLGSDRIWRPVVSSDGTLLNNGRGELNDGLPENSPVNFAGKTVIDLGCNVGAYTFMAAKHGAARATGTDIVPEAIEVCNILRHQNKLKNTDFFISDIMCHASPEKFDMALIIDIIGKNFILLQKIAPLLHTAACYARREIVMTFRPVYFLEETFREKAGDVCRKYPQDFIRDDKFYLYEYISHLLGSRWHMQAVTQAAHMEKKFKYLFHARRTA